MKYNAADFYDEPRTKIDEDSDYSWLLAHCICALSGAVVGFIIGYFVGYM